MRLRSAMRVTAHVLTAGWIVMSALAVGSLTLGSGPAWREGPSVSPGEAVSETCVASWTAIGTAMAKGDWFSVATGEPDPATFALSDGCAYDSGDPSNTPLLPRDDGQAWVAEVDGISVPVRNFEPGSGLLSLENAVDLGSTVELPFYFDAAGIVTPTPMPPPTSTPTAEPAPTSTAVPAPVPTATVVGPPAPTSTAEPPPSPTATPTLVPPPVPTATPTLIPPPVPTATPTLVPPPVPTATPTLVPPPAPTATPTQTLAPPPVPTATPTLVPPTVPTATPTLVPPPVPTATPTLVPPPVPTATPTQMLLLPPGLTATPTLTIVPPPAPTASPALVPPPVPSPAPTATPTPTPIVEARFTLSPTETPTSPSAPLVQLATPNMTPPQASEGTVAVAQAPPQGEAASQSLVASLPSLFPTVAAGLDSDVASLQMSAIKGVSGQATLAVEGGRGSAGDIVTVEIVVYDANVGIGAYELQVSVENPRAAMIVGVSLPGRDGPITSDLHELPASAVTLAGSGFTADSGGAVARGVLARVEVELLTDEGSRIDVLPKRLEDGDGQEIIAEIRPDAVLAHEASAPMFAWVLVLSGLALAVAAAAALRLRSRRLSTIWKRTVGKK